MNISTTNIIRFPALSQPVARAAQPVEQADEGDSNVVEFPAAQGAAVINFGAQQHGMIFAAHRLASRAADLLDAVQPL